MDPSVFHAPSGRQGGGWMREGATNPLVLSAKTPYLAEKICESDCRVRNKQKS